MQNGIGRRQIKLSSLMVLKLNLFLALLQRMSLPLFKLGLSLHSSVRFLVHGLFGTNLNIQVFNNLSSFQEFNKFREKTNQPKSCSFDIYLDFRVLLTNPTNRIQRDRH